MNKSFKIRLAILLFLIFIPAIAALSIIFFGQGDVSATENRNLTKLPAFGMDSFMKGDFQDTLEDALCDQIPGAEQIKLAVKDTQGKMTSAGAKLLSSVAEANYIEISEGYYHYRGSENRIVEKPLDYTVYEDRLASTAQLLSAPEGVKTYLYFIENSRTVDFDDASTSGNVYNWIREVINPDGSDVFSVNSYEDFCRDFYQTDHHWKANASYEGYKAIVRMLKGDGAVIYEPASQITVPVVFNGSYARLTQKLCADEEFTFYTFDLPKYRTFINGKKNNYGHMSMYERGKYPDDSLRNHYSYCYGGDYAEIMYDFGTEGNGNLLMVASSYSNPINDLIASYFDKTYVIDLRYYEDYSGHAFDIAAYCAENSIDTVLLLGDVNMFLIDEAQKGGDAE